MLKYCFCIFTILILVSIYGLKINNNTNRALLQTHRNCSYNGNPFHQIFFRPYSWLKIVKNQSAGQHSAWWSEYSN